MKMRNLLLSIPVFLVTAALVGGVAAFMWGWVRFHQPGPLKEVVTFDVGTGQGVNIIAEHLLYQGAIANTEDTLIFRAAARLSGRQGELKAGEYELTPAITMAAIMDKMSRGDVIERRFVVPEGLTSWQIVGLLSKVEGLSGDIKVVPAEGVLLPETYQYERTDTRQDQIDHMKDAMKKVMDELWPQRAGGLPFDTPEQALTLASIVEKETGVAAERTRIAGVFINRLRQGIPLQSDPTVIYALTKGHIQNAGMGPLGRRLLKDDLEIDSPYNTYKNAGLPPGPIANPGRDSIAAVLNPEANDYLYFVADGTGGHVFARTLEEHNDNVASWKKIRKESGR